MRAICTETELFGISFKECQMHLFPMKVERLGLQLQRLSIGYLKVPCRLNQWKGYISYHQIKPSKFI